LENAKRSPGKPAIVTEDEIISYEECVERTRKLSGALAEIGISEGERIGLMLNNSVEFVLVLLAAADLGTAVVPLNNTIGVKDLVTAIDTSDINYIIGLHAVLERAFEHFQHEQKGFPVPHACCVTVGGTVNGCHNFLELMESASSDYELGAQDVDDELDYILTVTSGSTSDPKPIVFTQGTKIRRCFSAQESYGLTDQDIILVATPLYHSISQRLVLTPLILGATCVIMGKFTPDIWLEQVERRKVSFTIAVASQLEAISWTRKDIAKSTQSLRCLVSCCALLNSETKKYLATNFSGEFHECYGTSEVGVVSNLKNNDLLAKIHTAGKAVQGVDIQIVDDNNNVVPSGVIGEITCKSHMRFSRYYKNKQATQDSLLGGYFFTGDMGYLDAEGYLIFSGRKKDVIITGGANVYPIDIEAVIIEHPEVKECAVIGVPDKQFGEAVLALVINEKGAALTERDLQRYCMHNLADVQQPLAYLFVDDFPRTALGKVIKRSLTEQYTDFDATENLRSILENRC